MRHSKHPHSALSSLRFLIVPQCPSPPGIFQPVTHLYCQPLCHCSHTSLQLMQLLPPLPSVRISSILLRVDVHSITISLLLTKQKQLGVEAEFTGLKALIYAEVPSGGKVGQSQGRCLGNEGGLRQQIISDTVHLCGPKKII